MLSPENRKKHVLCSSAFRSATCGRTTGISVYHTAGKCVYHTPGKYVCYLQRFDIMNSSLSEEIKQRLMNLNDSRITKDGVLIIKASEERSQKKNKELALNRLNDLIVSVSTPPKKRIPTKPTVSSQIKRLEDKSKRSQMKAFRKKVEDID